MKKLLKLAVSWLEHFSENDMLLCVVTLFTTGLDSKLASASPAEPVRTLFVHERYKQIYDSTGNPVAVASRSIARPDCSCDKLAEVRERATKKASSVTIDCNLTLKRSDFITKRLIFEGPSSSGVTVNGNGATLFCGKKDSVNYNKDMIEVRSKSELVNGTRTWARPENITIKNLHITGAVRVWGMAKNAKGYKYDDNGVMVDHYKNSSRTINHTNTVRRNAPTGIVFDNVVITGVGRNPLYFGPGVSYSKLLNSEIKGESEKVAIYLDAESYRITIKFSYIHVATASYHFRPDQPLIAIDGSSFNVIMNNRFSSLNNGGIYLYRNCGEEGVIRHTTPSHNKIVNNVFYYDKYTGLDPAVYLSSKNAEFSTTGGFLGFCGDDEGYNFGSSKSDLDYARFNIVMQNQIYKRSVNEMIRTKNPIVNSPNYIGYNETVTKEVKRLAGCYIPTGYSKDFIVHGESIDVFKNSKGEPVCTGYKYTCSDGELNYSPVSTCTISKVNFECRASGNNNGCQKVVSCAQGQKIIGAKAAANLESGSVTFNELEVVKMNTLKVVRESDNFWEGVAFVGSTRVITGDKTITGINGLQSVAVGCKERDDNGGDCHIKGTLYCYGSSRTIVDLINEEPAAPNQVFARPGTPMTAEKAVPGEAKEQSRFELVVYPNPASHEFQVQIKGLYHTGKASLRVLDANGKVVEKLNDISSGSVIRLGRNYPKGLYMIEVVHGTEKEVKKLIKQ